MECFIDELKFTHRFVVGDWSDDGHGKKVTFSFKCTHSEEDIQKLYLQAAEKSGIWMHETLPYNDGTDRIELCCSYADFNLLPEHIRRLEDLGIHTQFITESIDPNYVDDDGNLSYFMHAESVFNVFMHMVHSQDNSVVWSMIKEKPLNGYWSKNFNYSFGYGVFP